MKKNVLLILVVVFFFTGLSVAQPPDKIIGDFEQTITNELFDEDPNIMDYWTFYEFRGVSSQFIISSSTTGVTLGNQSLRVEYPVHGNTPDKDGGAFTCEPLCFDIGDGGGPGLHGMEEDFSTEVFEEMNEAFFTHTNITMDITWDPADWVALDTSQPVTVQMKLSINSQNGHYLYSAPDIDTGNPDYPGFWDLSDFPTVHTRTCSWGILDEKAILNAAGGPGDWLEIIMNIKTKNSASGYGVIYLDNIRFNTLATASTPKPAFNEQNVDTLPTLSFIAGALATAHTLYFGSDAAEVNEATTDVHPNVTVVDLTDTSYTLTNLLDFYTTYYWRVDETDGSEVWPGEVWKFTTGGYQMIDNFESYPTTNIAYDDTRIFVTWRDKVPYKNANNVTVPGNGTRMTVTNGKPELATVYKGFQSLPLTYDNKKSPFISETDRTFDPALDFSTAHDGQAFGTLDIQIHGQFLSLNGFTDNGNDQYTVIGSGADIYGKADEFHFAYQPQPVEGAASITAKIESVENVHASAKAGVMIRDVVGGLVAEDPGSVYAAVLSLPDGDIVFQYRKTNGGTSEIVRPEEEHEFTLPYWVRISTDGRYITPQMSADGQDWVNIVEPNEISMYNYTVMGLAVTSHMDAGTPCTAEFSNVSLEGAESSIALSEDVGLKINEPENVYVRLEDNNGMKATANYEDDPNGNLVTIWNHWKLFSTPLSAFTGIDLTQIKKIVIGVGPNNGQKASEGQLYIDDVRLTLPANP